MTVEILVHQTLVIACSQWKVFLEANHVYNLLPSHGQEVAATGAHGTFEDLVHPAPWPTGGTTNHGAA